jgi:hypothetical protein
MNYHPLQKPDYHPLQSFFEAVDEFFLGNELKDALSGRRLPETYDGNLIIVGGPEKIYKHTKEMRWDIYKAFLDKFGEGGYDDPEKLCGVLGYMGIFDPDKDDRENALAFSPDFKLLGASRFVRNVDPEGLENSEAMRRAYEFKGDYINGRHFAGFTFSKLDPKNVSIIISKRGNSKIIFEGGEFSPVYSRRITREKRIA